METPAERSAKEKARDSRRQARCKARVEAAGKLAATPEEFEFVEKMADRGGVQHFGLAELACDQGADGPRTPEIVSVGTFNFAFNLQVAVGKN
jgi:hypothetical protein